MRNFTNSNTSHTHHNNETPLVSMIILPQSCAIVITYICNVYKVYCLFLFFSMCLRLFFFALTLIYHDAADTDLCFTIKKHP